MGISLIPTTANLKARVSTPCDLVARSIVIGRTRIDDDEDTDATLTYALTQNGSSAGSGSLTWEDDGYDNAWAARFTLPATAGVLTAVVTIVATVDEVERTTRMQTSIEVIA